MHLRTGQYIVEQRALPSPDPFSWTTALARDTYAGESRTRRFNLTHEWLAQAAEYGVWRLAGFAGVVAARALTMTAFCGLIGLVAWRRRGSHYAALGAALAAASVARIFAFDRPYQATYLFLGMTLTRLEFRRFLRALPAIFLLWANCHGGYFLGWILLDAWCVQALVERRRDRALWLASAASVAASFFNPNGFQVVPRAARLPPGFMQTQLARLSAPTIALAAQRILCAAGREPWPRSCGRAVACVPPIG